MLLHVYSYVCIELTVLLSVLFIIPMDYDIYLYMRLNVRKLSMISELLVKVYIPFS